MRYVSTSEYPEKKLKYSVGNTIVLDLGMVNTGVLPIENGGTGSETVQGARENLGLGSAATYNAGGNITTGNNSLVTGGTVAAYLNTLNLSSRTHIVIAAYDTKNPLKNNADYICTSTNASSVIKEALSKIKAGGKIELLDGTYQLNYKETEIQINTKNVTIGGSGFATAIKQPVDEGAGEARPIFAINAENVFIKNMMLCDVVVSSSVSMIMQKTQGALYRGVFFIYNGGNGNDSSCIEGSGNCCYTRLQSADCQKLF